MDPLTLIFGLFLSFFATAVPTALWAGLVWWCDRYEREPIPLLTAAFLWGALPAVLVALLLESWFDAPAASLGVGLVGEVVAASGIAPLVEELAKGAALLLILLFWRDEIDDVLDGILYGALIGFGFGMTENLLYFMGALAEGGWGNWGTTVFLRSVLFGLNHAFFTAFTGAGLGYARMARTGQGRYGVPLLALGAALLAHGIHNLGASLTSLNAAGLLLSLFNDGAGVLFVVVMIALALAQERRWLRVELATEVGRLLTEAEYQALVSLSGRWRMLAQARRVGGIGAVRAAGRFQQAATELAFRKHRARVRGANARLAKQITDLETRLSAARGQGA
jgi:RsiW-degrading membrane proteinase PrsW (M82 family)